MEQFQRDSASGGLSGDTGGRGTSPVCRERGGRELERIRMRRSIDTVARRPAQPCVYVVKCSPYVAVE